MPTEDATSRSFDRLAPAVQRWVWRRGWTELRDIQEDAVGPILDRRADVVIASATASGKTHAAYLPGCSDIAEHPNGGLRFLYLSPLKALINDQHQRLEDLCEAIDTAVTPWHGDVAASRKQRALKEPSGILLITPESLESLFVNRGSHLPLLFAGLRYVVVDELHAFIGAERGRQLQSLLHRVELATRVRLPRIGLSATLGDMALACDFLRPRFGPKVIRIVSTSVRREVRLQMRGYRITPPRVSASGSTGEASTIDSFEPPGDDVAVADDLYRVLRGGTHIVFANRRSTVEHVSDMLRQRAERDQLVNEFWPHHGNLSKEIREDAENALRGTKPATVIATTTLELGIDVGAVDSIAQIGAPQSVTSMRQRLGRSGRREDDPSILRIYIQEEEITDKTPPQDQLRSALVQSIAMVQLLLQKWTEPPPRRALHLSTLVHQVLSLVAQHGAVTAYDAWRVLCESGPFQNVDQNLFGALLRDMASHQLVTQTHDALLVLDLDGERLVNHYTFYAVFMTPEEFRLVAAGKTLGTLPIDYPIGPGSFLVYAGRRWQVMDVDTKRKLVELMPAVGGKPPKFGGVGAPIHTRVREEMLAVYISDHMPAFLDRTSVDLLAEGRNAFRRFNLERRVLLRWGSDTLIFPWTGDRVMDTLERQLVSRGLQVGYEGIALLVAGTVPTVVLGHLDEICHRSDPDPIALARTVKNKVEQKYHPFLGESLLCIDYAASRLDVRAAVQAAQRIVTLGDCIE